MALRDSLAIQPDAEEQSVDFEATASRWLFYEDPFRQENFTPKKITTNFVSNNNY
jgi:hypothetical protein